MQFAHNGYYKGSNPLGLKYSMPKASIKLVHYLLIDPLETKPA
jgi:hypothetical protein